MKYTLMEKHLVGNDQEISCTIRCENDDKAVVIERAAQLAAGMQFYSEELEKGVDVIYFTIVEEAPLGFDEKRVAEYFVETQATYLLIGGNTFKLI